MESVTLLVVPGLPLAGRGQLRAASCELRAADKKQRSWAAAGLAISLARLGSAWASGGYLTQGKADDTANSEMGMARCGW